MEKLEHFKKRFDTAKEGAFGSEIGKIEKIKATEYLATIFRAGESKCNRLEAMFSLIRKIIPALGYKYNKENLPFDPESYEFKDGTIDKGAENHVYLMESKKENSPSWVLKINRQDHGDIGELAKRAGEIKSEFEKVKGWYESIPGLVPEEYSMILEDPLDGKPAIATLQKYYGSDIRDIFREINRDELNSLLAEDPLLKEDFFKFIKISEEQFEKTGEMIDFVGLKNVSLIKINGAEKLIILDPHTISEHLKNNEKARNEQIEMLKSLRGLANYKEKE